MRFETDEKVCSLTHQQVIFLLEVLARKVATGPKKGESGNAFLTRIKSLFFRVCHVGKVSPTHHLPLFGNLLNNQQQDLSFVLYVATDGHRAKTLSQMIHLNLVRRWVFSSLAECQSPPR